MHMKTPYGRGVESGAHPAGNCDTFGLPPPNHHRFSIPIEQINPACPVRRPAGQNNGSTRSILGVIDSEHIEGIGAAGNIHGSKEESRDKEVKPVFEKVMELSAHTAKNSRATHDRFEQE